MSDVFLKQCNIDSKYACQFDLKYPIRVNVELRFAADSCLKLNIQFFGLTLARKQFLSNVYIILPVQDTFSDYMGEYKT